NVGIRRLGDFVARPALRRANVIEAPWLHIGGHTDASARHWRKYSDLQRDQLRSAASAGSRATRTTGAHSYRHEAHILPELPRSGGGDARLLHDGRAFRRHVQSGTGRGEGKGYGRVGDGQLFFSAGGLRRTRTRFRN